MSPLRSVIGNATVVGLGDDTHGTHEFFDVKVKMIQFLVQEMHFTNVALEGPFADFNRLNDYALGGQGDPHAILLHRENGYWFWATEEIVALAEWMRAYNANRGSRAAVQIAGFDVTDEKGAAALAIAYLNSVDPASPTNDLDNVKANLVAHEADFVARSSQREFDACAAGGDSRGRSNACSSQLHRVLALARRAHGGERVQLSERRGKIILWGHQEHLGKTINIQGSKPMGKWLQESFGAGYFAIGTSAGDGMFNVYFNRLAKVINAQFPAIDADAYEQNFRSAGVPVLLIPLRIELPDWLSGVHNLRGGSASEPTVTRENLKQKLDAMIYVDQTTRSNNFW